MGCAHGSGNKSDHCRLQKAGIAFKGEKQQLRRAPRKAAEKNKSAAQDADYRGQLGGESWCEACGSAMLSLLSMHRMNGHISQQ